MKERLDVLLTEQGFFDSRERARIAVMEGLVYVDGQKEDKPGTKFSDTAKIEVRGETLRYVSRGGLKLEKAMELWPIRLAGKTCMDVGASTGGFTDCMLQNGADKVYSVDVGYGQLHWKLRNDPRVVNLEKTNARYLTRNEVPDPVDFVSVDVSFISLTKILEPVKALLSENAGLVTLVKPQFEAGREKVGKKGVVREASTHAEVIRKVTEYAESIGFSVLGLTYSPVKGPEGNIEYLAYLRNGALPEDSGVTYDVDAVVEESHRTLG